MKFRARVLKLLAWFARRSWTRRYSTQTVRLEPAAGRAVATNGAWLVVLTGPPASGPDVLVPAAYLRDCAQAANREGAHLEFSEITDGAVMWQATGGSGRILTHEGIYPEWLGLLPSFYDAARKIVHLDARHLKRLCELAIALAGPDQEVALRFSLGGQGQAVRIDSHPVFEPRLTAIAMPLTGISEDGHPAKEQ